MRTYTDKTTSARSKTNRQAFRSNLGITRIDGKKAREQSGNGILLRVLQTCF